MQVGSKLHPPLLIDTLGLFRESCLRLFWASDTATDSTVFCHQNHGDSESKEKYCINEPSASLE